MRQAPQAFGVRTTTGQTGPLDIHILHRQPLGGQSCIFDVSRCDGAAIRDRLSCIRIARCLESPSSLPGGRTRHPPQVKRDIEMGSESGPPLIELLGNLQYQPAWLTWVASATSCLSALDIQCDLADVAGFSGYAFHLGIHEEVCPSGPTTLDWSRLSRGIHFLGRSTVEFRSLCCDESGRAREDACRAAFALVEKELQSGRPCILWGTYLPEFGVVVGTEGEAYRVKTFKEVLQQEQPLIPYRRTESPGGVYALGFPSEEKHGELLRDLEAIMEALRLWNRPAYGKYRFGAEAYDLWVEALGDQRAGRFGCGYNAACYAEGRLFAQQFFERMSTRRPLACELLRAAAHAYGEAADAVRNVSEIFPFCHDVEGSVTDKGKIDQASRLLRKARDAEAKAMDHLAEITKMQVERSQ